MKRKFMVAAMAFALVFVLAGCGSSNGSGKVVCTQSVSSGSASVDIEFNITLSGGAISAMDFNYGMDLSSYSDSQISAIEKRDYCTVVKSYMSTYKNAIDGCEQSVSDKKLSVVSKFDVSKLPSEIKSVTTTTEAKEQMESAGYKCTIK